ncbi:MAG: hypothetical protein RLZZ537_584 [Pseudomonadota bacterium]|jgi:glycosyltransferase involved in cell wall biosynthesis
MKTALIITTYNWPLALSLVLKSVREQSLIPDEVIIADDGSEDETRRLIQREALDFPCTLKHSWQEDIGFRVARSRNLAIASSKSDYIILIDGDMVLHRHFVRDHIKVARAGFFTQGSRVLMSAPASAKLLTTGQIKLNFFSPGIVRRRHTLRLPLLGQFWLQLTAGKNRHGIKTCNQAWQRDDLIRLNGFDERMMAWGCEDEELAARAFHSGLKRQDCRFTALAYHLWHKERRNNDCSPNLKFLHETNRLQLTRAADGLDKHIYTSGHDAYARSPDTISGNSS